jgi:hypothetical protein
MSTRSSSFRISSHNIITTRTSGIRHTLCIVGADGGPGLAVNWLWNRVNKRLRPLICVFDAFFQRARFALVRQYNLLVGRAQTTMASACILTQTYINKPCDRPLYLHKSRISMPISSHFHKQILNTTPP